MIWFWMVIKFIFKILFNLNEINFNKTKLKMKYFPSESKKY